MTREDRRTNIWRPLRGRGFGRVVVVAVTIALFVGHVPVVSAAQSWTFDLSASSVPSGQSGSVFGTVVNTSDGTGGGDSIGCVIISVPAAFTVDAVSIDSVTNGHVWTIVASGTGPTLVTAMADGDGDRLRGDPDFDQLVIRVDVTAVGAIGDYVWTADEFEKPDCSQDHLQTLTRELDISAARGNTAPSATDDSGSVVHDRTRTVNAPGVLANDTDADGDPLTAVKDSDPTHGSVSLAADGSYTYTPDAGYVGPDAFTYHAFDGAAASGSVTVSLNVTNATPVGVVDAYATLHGIPITRPAGTGVLANDTDADGDVLTASLVSGPSHGTLSLDADGGFQYTPDLLWLGSDSFTYQVTDGVVVVGPITVSLNTTNDAPIAGDDAYAVVHDGSLAPDAASGVLADDDDPNGDPLSAILVTDVTHGALTLTSDGSFTYTPDPGFVGPDAFTYRASDGFAASSPATVTIDVTDQTPTAADDNYSSVHDAALNVAVGSGILANDADGDGDPLTAVLIADVAHGTLTLDPDGSFDYVPDAGYVGSDGFTYQASSPLATSAVASVAIQVTDAAPSGTTDAFAVHTGVILDVDASNGVLANDTDPDGDPITATLASDVTHGTLTLAADGSFTYRSDAGYVGPDAFTYRATDGLVPSAAIAVTIDVQDAAPTASDISAVVVHDRVALVAAPGLLVGAADVDGDPLTAVLDTQATHGTATVAPGGSWTYTPDAGYVGPDAFTFLVHDGALTSAPATVSLDVTDAAPIATDDAATVVHDRTLSVAAPGLLANDTDADGDAMATSLVAGPANGALTVAADGSYAYTPHPGFVGTDTFTYLASDGILDSASATVTILVTNAAPAPSDDGYTTHAGTSLVVPLPGVLANDLDADGDALTVTITTDPSHGVAVLTPNGSLSYQPDPGWVGTDSFVYLATDGLTGTTAQVTIGVKNSSPSGSDDEYTTPRGIPLAVGSPGVLTNDGDADGDALTAVLVGTTAHGDLTLLSTGGFTYAPDAGYAGTDVFTYRVSDGLATSALVRVRIGVVASAPEPTPTPAPTDEPLPVPDPSPVVEPSPTPSPSPSPTPTPTPTAGPSATSAPTDPPNNGATSETFTVGQAEGETDAGVGEAVFGASVALALDGFEWQLPGLLLSVPGLLVIVAIASQVFGGLAWLPFVRRKLGAFGVDRTAPLRP